MKTVTSMIVLALGLSACASADVATVRRNLDKYWLYRNLQRTDYIEVGAGQARSVPACWRNPGTGVVKWADTTIDLGWYIGALATEHYMLSHPELYPGYSSGDSGALNTVRYELYYAISAMDRLDAVAEASFNPTAPDTPGFFLRDDVPASFYAYFPGMTVALSDFSNTVSIYDKEMSQDQAIHVLLGLALAKKLIPPDLVVNGMNLRQAAINRGAAIVDWVHHNGWMIQNPVTGNDVVRGPDARSFATGFNDTVVYLTDGAVSFSGSISGFWEWVWGTLSSPTNPAYDNRNNLHMAMSLAATGNGWGNANTLDALMNLAAAHDWYAYILLYAVLWDPIPQMRPTWSGHQSTINGLVQTMLNSAPSTTTPHHPNNPGEYNTGWCGSRRFIITREAQNNGEGQYTAGECYNGLDYLLLHNLFYMITLSRWEDPTPPANVTGFTATPGDTQVSLSWTNPSDFDFVGTMIRYKTTGYPTGPTDGTLVIDKFKAPGTSDSYVHTGLANGTPCYYTAFAHDVAPNYAAGALATATPADTAAPAQVTTFTATPGNQQNALSWANPGTADFAGTMIRYNTYGYPASPSDGTLVCSRTNSPGSSDSFTHTPLINGMPYYYSAFAYDEVPHHAPAATANGTPTSGNGCFSEGFAYNNGNLNGNGAWSGNATVQITVVGQAVKIAGGAGSRDAVHTISCSGGSSGIIEVRTQIKGGTGSSTMWSVWIDDTAGNNLARWYGAAGTAIGRIGGTSIVTPAATLTGGWDNLIVRIDTAANQSHFLFNGSLLGMLDHTITGAGNTAGRVWFQRMDNGGAAGQYLYFDNLWIGEGDGTAPGPVTSFQAVPGNGCNYLSWTNPADADLAGVRVLCKTTGFPTGPTDGTVVYQGAGRSCTHEGLSNGTMYYYAAYAYDAVLNYSTSAQASAAPVYFTPAQAKMCGDATLVTITVGVASAVFSDSFYVQCVDDSCGACGIKVYQTSPDWQAGQSAVVRGTVLTDPATGERYIAPTWLRVNGSGTVEPVGVTNLSLGGSGWNYHAGTGAGQRGIAGAPGLNNTGLLVRAWGRVTQRDSVGLSYFYIDDGSGIRDTTLTAGADNIGVRVNANPTGRASGDFVEVTGISSCFKDGSGNVRRLVLPVAGGIRTLSP